MRGGLRNHRLRAFSRAPLHLRGLAFKVLHDVALLLLLHRSLLLICLLLLLHHHHHGSTPTGTTSPHTAAHATHHHRGHQRRHAASNPAPKGAFKSINSVAFQAVALGHGIDRCCHLRLLRLHLLLHRRLLRLHLLLHLLLHVPLLPLALVLLSPPQLLPLRIGGRLLHVAAHVVHARGQRARQRALDPFQVPLGVVARPAYLLPHAARRFQCLLRRPLRPLVPLWHHIRSGLLLHRLRHHLRHHLWHLLWHLHLRHRHLRQWPRALGRELGA